MFLTLGLAFFLFAAVVRVPQELDEAELQIIRERLAVAGAPTRPRRAGDPGAETGLSPALTAAVALERPLVMGSAGPGMASPSLETFEADARQRRPGDVGDGDRCHDRVRHRRRSRRPIAPSRRDRSQRVRQHPYVRLALNGSFSALWAGQLISLFGDRLNQLALVAVVAISTGSALATGLVFFAATLPNLLLSPIAGTFVDRWDHKEVMVVSDILRAAIVLILPVAAVTNIVLVYPLIFLVTSISVFFRPARVAILPRDRPGGGPAQRELGAVGRRDDRRRHRLPAGRPVRRAPRQRRPARVLGRQRDLPGVGGPDRHDRRPASWSAPRPTRAHLDPASSPSSTPAGSSSGTRRSCWRTRSRARSASSASALSIALTPSFVQTTFSGSGFGWQAAYGFLETGIGLGNLIGGFVVGLIGARFAKGRMVIAGYALWGVLILLFALSNNLGVAIGLAFGQGVANMIFVIPSQTLFQERTPQRADGSRRRVPVRAGLRLDDDRDAARLGPRPDLRTGAGHGGLRAGHGRRPAWPGCSSRRCATPEERCRFRVGPGVHARAGRSTMSLRALLPAARSAVQAR